MENVRQQLLSEITLGDMTACYVRNEQQNVGLVLLPASMPYPQDIPKNMEIDGLIQLKLAGDIYNEAYGQGVSLRNSESVRNLVYENQTIEETDTGKIIRTILKDKRGYRATHILEWHTGNPYVRIHCTFANESEKTVRLELFESFSISGITPYIAHDAPESLKLYRIRSVWSQEGRMEVIPFEDLQLEPAWAPHAVRCERFGEAGSMPVNRFFPFVAVEDTVHHVFWGSQIAYPASWQMEVYRKDDGAAISGGLADRELGHWMKDIAPSEIFATPEAIVSVARIQLEEKLGEEAEFDIFCQRLVSAAERGLSRAPESEKDLPVIFNEYCTTWGNPSDENIEHILDVIKGRGFSYFVIDCGWYKQEGIPWDHGMGDYDVSPILFPQGLEKTVQKIKDAGLVPGIWFEIENVASAAKVYQETEHLLKRDGYPLTTYFRRFFDMRDDWVQDYLTEKVIGTLKKYGFGYMKTDYNETIGIGCDGAESLGEGLRQYMEADMAFLDKVKREIPDIVLENCSSGGHRLEPSLMEKASMASFSDAHECVSIPIIAADLHRVIHPAQSQIWAVIRKADSLKRIAYSIANTFLGRMCISGDVTELSDTQWDVIDRGIAFYKAAAPVIRNGQTYRWGPKVRSMNHPKGWQVVVRANETKTLVILHTFEGEHPKELTFALPSEQMKVVNHFSKDAKAELVINGRHCSYRPGEDFEAAAFLLERMS